MLNLVPIANYLEFFSTDVIPLDPIFICISLLSSVCISFVSIDQKRQELDALQEESEAKNQEISAQGRLALADFLLGTPELKSPSARMQTLATVMEEESSAPPSPTSEFSLSIACVDQCDRLARGVPYCR